MVDINWIDPLKYLLGFVLACAGLFTLSYAFAYGFSSAWTHARIGAEKHQYRLELIESLKAQMGGNDEDT